MFQIQMLLCLAVMALFSTSAWSASSTVKRLAPENYTVTVLADSLDHPWSLATLPDGSLLITERVGRLRVFADGELSAPVQGVPPVFARSQGGLFDVVLHPDYVNNGWLYLSYAHGDASANATRLARARLEGDSLIDLEVLFTAKPFKNTPVHYGGRFAFLADGTLLLSVGDGFDFREEAQRLSSHLGTLVRLNDDGSVPIDNPFVGADSAHPDALPEIYSYGHRNAQAIVVRPSSGEVLANEHGPAGGDELNRIVAGANYGWPVATGGRDYSGAAISPFTEYPGMTAPLVEWTPSIAPAGMAVITGEAFAELEGDLLVVALKAREARRLRLDGDTLVEQESVFGELGFRLRDVRVADDGSLYLLTDAEQGRLLHITKPAITRR